jgi:hypothetical protein
MQKSPPLACSKHLETVAQLGCERIYQHHEAWHSSTHSNTWHGSTHSRKCPLRILGRTQHPFLAPGHQCALSTQHSCVHAPATPSTPRAFSHCSYRHIAAAIRNCASQRQGQLSCAHTTSHTLPLTSACPETGRTIILRVLLCKRSRSTTLGYCQNGNSTRASQNSNQTIHRSGLSDIRNTNRRTPLRLLSMHCTPPAPEAQRKRQTDSHTT